MITEAAWVSCVAALFAMMNPIGNVGVFAFRDAPLTLRKATVWVRLCHAIRLALGAGGFLSPSLCPIFAPPEKKTGSA
jgi:hypothetical protein